MMKEFRLAIAALTSVFLSITSGAQAQCSQTWHTGPLTAPIPGANGPIHAIHSWSLPGQPLQLVVGGAFTHIGGIAANNIAMWDGYFWHALDNGRSGPVYALTTYNSSLIAAGEGPIGAWNGSTWVDRGAASGTTLPGDVPAVRALIVYNGELLAGGNFQSITPNPGFPGQGNLWRFNGTAWFNVPAGVGTAVRALELYDADAAGPGAPLLYIGGEGASTACLRTWNGSVATDIAGPYHDTLGNAGRVMALKAISQNQVGNTPAGLMVAGDFAHVSASGGSTSPAHDVAYYNGSTWFGFDNTGNSQPHHIVFSLTVVGSLLYAGGVMDVPFYPGQHVKWFNGSIWSPIELGPGGVNVVQNVNNQLVAGGEFTATSAGLPAGALARRNGTSWVAYAEPLIVRAMTRIGSRVVMGGYFSNATPTTSPAGSINRYNISTWDYIAEGGLGWGTNGIVMALLGYTTGSGATLTNNVVAAGEFSVCGPTSTGSNINVNRVAIWSEPAISPAGWSAMGSGFNGMVRVLDRFNGWVVAAGQFTASGGTTTNRVAKYVGSPPSWQPLTSPDPGINGTVHALKAFSDEFGGLNNYLVMGGDFTAAPATGVAANRVLMRVENPVAGQSSYQALGAGFNGTVYAIERYGSGLSARTYAAGAFTASGTVNIYRVARLVGGNWSPFGNGIGFDGTVFALKTVGNFMYAAGSFNNVDGIPAKNLAKWNGTAWSAATGGADRAAYALMGFQSELIAAGEFDFVQAGEVSSPGAARLKVTGAPWIARQPVSQTRACGAIANFEVVIPEGYEGAARQWRLDGVAISNGVTAHGSIIEGASTSMLSISNVQQEDAGAYDCVITSACGNVTSTSATLTIDGSCCPADISDDSQVNVTDLLAVINAWGPCAAPCPPSCSADIAAGNCQVDVSDLLLVINTWGVCP